MKIIVKKIPAGLKDNHYVIMTEKQTLYVSARVYNALIQAYYQVPRIKRYGCIEAIQITQYSFDLTKEKWEEIKPLYHQCTEGR